MENVSIGSDLTSEMRDAISEKLRFLELAAHHGDYVELGFITQHIAAALKRMELEEAYNLALQLEHSVNGQSSRIKEEVDTFGDYLSRLFQGQSTDHMA